MITAIVKAYKRSYKTKSKVKPTVTGTGDYAYRRHDGVYVVPIGSLKN